MAIGNGELLHECFLRHLRMRTARMKQGKETDEESKTRAVSMDISKTRTKGKKEVTTTNYHNQNKMVNIICKHFIRDGKSPKKFN